MSKIDPLVFQPFGAGPRICIGMRFALIAVKMAICKILLNFRLDAADDTPVSKSGCNYFWGEPQSLHDVKVVFIIVHTCCANKLKTKINFFPFQLHDDSQLGKSA